MGPKYHWKTSIDIQLFTSEWKFKIVHKVDTKCKHFTPTSIIHGSYQYLKLHNCTFFVSKNLRIKNLYFNFFISSQIAVKPPNKYWFIYLCIKVSMNWECCQTYPVDYKYLSSRILSTFSFCRLGWQLAEFSQLPAQLRTGGAQLAVSGNWRIEGRPLLSAAAKEGEHQEPVNVLWLLRTEDGVVKIINCLKDAPKYL